MSMLPDMKLHPVIGLFSLVCLASTLQIMVAAPGQEQTNPSTSVIWVEDALTKVMPSAKNGEKAWSPLNLNGARRETVSGQVVFRPSIETRAARASITDLKHRASGDVLPASAIQLQWVRYIDITRNSDVPANERVAQAPASIPDPFWDEQVIPVKAERVQPLWIEIQIPEKTQPGDYDGMLMVDADGTELKLPVSVHIWGFTLPAEQRLSVVNWWQFPGAGFENHGADDWDLLGRFARFLVEHRQTDLQTEIHRISESGDAQRGYTHDTSRLERFAEAAFTAGIRHIHLHSVGRRTADILDPQCRVELDESNLRRLGAWEKVIQRRSWQGRFFTSIVDEPFVYYEDSYAAAVGRVHQTAPSVRCLEAVEAEYLGPLDVYVPKLSHLAMWYPRFEQVRRDGAQLWFYVCCHPLGRYPNRFLDQTLLQARVLFWIHYLYNLDGYLHWGLNQYAGDPYTQEGISQDLPLGDRAIVYPGKEGLIGSLRFSAQRDGIQDFEYLRVLEEQLRQIKARIGPDGFWIDPRQRSLELCRRVLWSFHDYTRDPRVLLEARQAIATEIESLQTEPLLVLQTSPPEGTVVPAGPRAVNLRGLVPPGAKVTIDGKTINNLRPSGYFCQAAFLGDNQPRITVAVEHAGRKTSAVRVFKLAD
jgi:hypothetical protein